MVEDAADEIRGWDDNDGGDDNDEDGGDDDHDVPTYKGDGEGFPHRVSTSHQILC